MINETLPIGHAANAAGVLAVTLATRVDGLPGKDLVDADGQVHPGLIPIGLTVLQTDAQNLKVIRDRAFAAAGASAGEAVTLIDFPVQGQQTNDYEDFGRQVAQTPTAELQYLGIALHGPRKAINKLVGKLSLLR